ncbi:hypothetical protein HF086_003755 [Spodoptera exigua]|uniref:Uncharacterized protein n=1 Tax=Spodoptera exigua TaxID=7107 RepID=A0A922MX28_SPOEX|nr:hypothetical protein HF086_003755 [Spodoptera exigua]
MNKMLALFVLCGLSSVLSAPLEGNSHRLLPPLDHEEVHDEFGQFALRYVTAEGTVVSERGRLIPAIDGAGYVMVYEGEVSYIGDDGKRYVTKYTAGLDGYHAEGDHLPVAPEVPEVPEPKPVK